MNRRTKLLSFLLVLVFDLHLGSTAQAASVLKSIARTDESSRLQIYLNFDFLPGHETTTTGRRIDLILNDTVPTEQVALLSGDSRMIKMISKRQEKALVFSFYFRYPPQKVSLNSTKETGTLMLDILLGNPVSLMYPDLATRLEGITVLDRPATDASNPLRTSRYAGNWVAFFSLYETPVTITPSPRLTLPPFPLAAGLEPLVPNEDWLPEEVRILAEEEQWTQIPPALRGHLDTEKNERKRERMLLTYAEALVRGGEFGEPFELLQEISLTSPDTMLAYLAQVLYSFLHADHGDPALAYFDLDPLLRKIGTETPFTVWLNLLHAETALASGRYDDATRMLARDDLAYPGEARDIRLLRQADLRYKKRETIKALVAYSQLAGQSKIINTDPMSMAGFGDVLYSHNRYPEAAEKYQLLTELLDGKKQQDLALFRLAMSRLHDRATAASKKAEVSFQQIADAFPGTEGGDRARMKLTDLDYLSGRIDTKGAQASYDQLSREGSTIDLREEALFKLALINSLSGHTLASTEQCLDLLRGFQSGALRGEAQALIIAQIPGVIKQLVRDKDYIKALVLAKQNRDLFAQGWLGLDLLYDLATAYGELGLFDQVALTYQYIFDFAGEGEQEKIYIPLLQALYAGGQYAAVENYADRYFSRYPEGQDAGGVFLHRVKALLADGQAGKAIRLLDDAKRPQGAAIDLLAASAYFDQKRWQEVIDILTRPEMKSLVASGDMTFILAESLYQNGQNDPARPLFLEVAAGENNADQARFRLAQLAFRDNNMPEALNQFKELADKGKDPLWTKLAQEEAAILQLEQRK